MRLCIRDSGLKLRQTQLRPATLFFLLVLVVAPLVQLSGDARRGFLRGAAPLWSHRSSLTDGGTGGLFDGRHARLQSRR